VALAVLCAPGWSFAQDADPWAWPSKELPVFSATVVASEMMQTIRRLPARGRFETSEEYTQRWRSTRYVPEERTTLAEPALFRIVMGEGGPKTGRCTKDYDADRALYRFECRTEPSTGFARESGAVEIEQMSVYRIEAQVAQLAAGPKDKERRPTAYFAGLGSLTSSGALLGRHDGWSAQLSLPRERARTLDRGLTLFAAFQPVHPLATLELQERLLNLEFQGRRQPHKVVELTLLGEVHELWLVDTLNRRVVFRADPKSGRLEVNPEYQ
jgi:hypothetical protein